MGQESDGWEPLSVQDVTELLDGVDAPWWIAGGWALDLHLGRQTRPHHDIDVLVLRADLPTLRERLRGWDLQVADPPGAGVLRPWPESEVLAPSLHDIWCRRTPTSPWSLQLMVDDTDGPDWVYRRDHRIRRPVSELYGPASIPGRPVLAPEVQLLGKSRTPRPKDVADFQRVAGTLDERQRAWLREALTTVAPGHEWLPALQPG
ncbi:Aminoglycoside-2''-adenylyltransferase [Blastococcus aurantiacus]|uniref:Aminoglycoside-2''-adenylyltransferase n=1 Tax=Blastococcus aurantiacus TaxID=1550231 RepID=A0A1G7M3X3_9ACTN|nr:hypothetical protein [Blastococcus aurantiacus]SDF56383.1 Aminoglycoside-2''-adenylyltransferase [Blastococcus aurantiacus]